MKLQSDRNFLDPEVEDSVRVSIPQVDWGKTSAGNILAYVTEMIDHKFFSVHFNRSEFVILHRK